MRTAYLILAALPGITAAVLVTRAMLTAHAETTPEAIERMLATPSRYELGTSEVETVDPMSEGAERWLIHDLLTGRITADAYRRAVGDLAAHEPQPRALQQLLG